MNDACSVMVERINVMLPELEGYKPLTERIFIQEVSGNVGTVFELDMNKFTQEELVLVFEVIVGAYQIRELRKMFGLD